MDKISFINNMKLDIQRIQSAIVQAESLEQNKVYEFKVVYGFRHDERVLGVVRGFSYGPMSCGVRIEILGTDYRGRNKSMTLSLFSELNIKPVPYSDFPKYIGWEGLRGAFTTRLKNINKYIAKETKVNI